ncbi:NAD-dependent epimerase/dehydratase family protein [Cobetia sp. L2A1]|uniref:NAD-dependent epimerase/dehydratase family protein n=1 Tax=Cobetia sp. L2A1 TaxID=2686360 RepID=UPI00131DD916|nr:NAD-dependent epimerase/dehydratase family protein [Cobetia sp. L2A1]
MKILITGAAGFIGAALCERLLKEGLQVVGLDNLNPYYPLALKRHRLARLEALAARPNAVGSFRFVKMDLIEREALMTLMQCESFDVVVNLAAQAGVRHSISQPHDYVDSNLVGFVNLLEACRAARPRHLLYASSSSVYGDDTRQPLTEGQAGVQPLSLYAATKQANELMAYSYAHLYGLPVTGLRFFTVYGARGRPDMAPLRFARKLLAGEAIDVYNHGQMARDFTHISDIVESIRRLMVLPPTHEANTAPSRVLNVGRGEPVALGDFISGLEDVLGIKARKRLLPMQAGDVERTWADTTALEALSGFRPGVSLSEGLAELAGWVRAYPELLAEEATDAAIPDPICQSSKGMLAFTPGVLSDARAII